MDTLSRVLTAQSIERSDGMDIYSYLNSKDVAAYCRETGKTMVAWRLMS